MGGVVQDLGNGGNAAGDDGPMPVIDPVMISAMMRELVRLSKEAADRVSRDRYSEAASSLAGIKAVLETVAEQCVMHWSIAVMTGDEPENEATVLTLPLAPGYL